MTRSTTVLAMCVVLVGGVAFAADEDPDPIGAKLATAKAEYEKSMEKARDGLLADLKKRAETATKAGDLKALDKVDDEVKALEEKGSLPKLVSTRDYTEAKRVAGVRLKNAYETAVREYTVAGKKEFAKATQAALEDFKKETTGNVPKEVAPNDGFAVGTEVKGTYVSRWGPPGKRESGEGGFSYTVTKRSGNKFTITFDSGTQAEGKVENGTVSYTITIARKQANVGKVSFFGRLDKDKGTLVGRTLSKNNPTWSQEVRGEIVKEK